MSNEKLTELVNRVYITGNKVLEVARNELDKARAHHPTERESFYKKAIFTVLTYAALC